MKIVAVLEDDVASGGGFNQALNAVLQMRRLCEGRFEYEVLTTQRANVGYLRELDIAAELFAFSPLDRLLARLSTQSWWHSLQIRLRAVGPFERRMLARGCDLVYFVTPSGRSRALQRLNFIATLWDLCHRDALEFPESREFAQFQLRETEYATRLTPALAVLTDSAALADAAARRYGIDRERLLPMPFAPNPFLGSRFSLDKAAVLRKHGLEEGYFFYPAQFWAHKNHVRIVQALAILAARGARPRVVFAGGEKGNRSHVERAVAAAGLRDQVRFLGFVPAQDMRALYEGCAGVVMPTYFGPTNIPPLEAWSLGKPLIYSSQFREQVGDTALCVDPDDASALADAMQACTDAATASRLAALGAARLKEIERERTAAEADLLARLDQFAARRACWA